MLLLMLFCPSLWISWDLQLPVNRKKIQIPESPCLCRRKQTSVCHSSAGCSEKGKQNQCTTLTWTWHQERIQNRPCYLFTLRTEGPTLPTPERSTEMLSTASWHPITYGIKSLTSDLKKKKNLTKPKKNTEKKPPQTWGVCWCFQRPKTCNQQQSKCEVSKSQPPPREGGDPVPHCLLIHQVTAALLVMTWNTHIDWYSFIPILKFQSFNTEALFHYTKMQSVSSAHKGHICYRKSWEQNKVMHCHSPVDMGGRAFSSASDGKGGEFGQEAKWWWTAASDASKSWSHRFLKRNLGWVLGFFCLFLNGPPLWLTLLFFLKIKFKI